MASNIHQSMIYPDLSMAGSRLVCYSMMDPRQKIGQNIGYRNQFVFGIFGTSEEGKQNC